MFNKNDPIAASVKQVMEQNARERAAAAAVNEKFGIVDRKALPHERQGEWDAAYKATLSEELKGNQHKIDANKNGKVDGGDFPLLKMKKKLAESGGTSSGFMIQADKERKQREASSASSVKYTPQSADSQRAASTTGQGQARQKAGEVAAKNTSSISPGGTSSSEGKKTASGSTATAPVAPKPKLRPSGMSTKKTVVKKVQPTGSSAPKQKEPSAFQKWEARRRLEKGQSLGPQYNRDRKISGTKLGVTTGKTVFQRKK